MSTFTRGKKKIPVCEAGKKRKIILFFLPMAASTYSSLPKNSFYEVKKLDRNCNYLFKSNRPRPPLASVRELIKYPLLLSSNLGPYLVNHSVLALKRPILTHVQALTQSRNCWKIECRGFCISLFHPHSLAAAFCELDPSNCFFSAQACKGKWTPYSYHLSKHN